MTPHVKEMDCDVLVIGDGGAGLRTALEATRNGLKTIIVSKLPPNEPNSTSVIDSWGTYRESEEAEDYFRLVVEEGNYTNDQDLA